MSDLAPISDEDVEAWQFQRFRVTFSSLLGDTASYNIHTRCGQHKAVAVALRNHLLGPHGFFEDFPLNVRVEPLEGSSVRSGDLGDLNEG